MKDLPNMGEKERGKVDKPTQDSATPSDPVLNESRPDSNAATQNRNGSRVARPPALGPNERGLHWTTTLGRIVWEKWRWGVFMVVAVVVARFSSWLLASLYGLYSRLYERWLRTQNGGLILIIFSFDYLSHIIGYLDVVPAFCTFTIIRTVYHL